MTEARNATLGELAADAALERTDFLARSGEQLHRFLDANRDRIREIGGMTLIDDDPDYLSIAPDLTFRVRSRYLDEATNEWISETEVVESAAELVELYNPSDVFAAFAEAAREAAGLPAEPTGAEDLMEVAGIAPDETVIEDAGYAEAADAWAAGQEPVGEPSDELDAARRMYDLALSFQERSQRSESRLLEQFEEAAARLAPTLGELVIVDDDDERLVLTVDGSLRGEVLPEDAEGGVWRSLLSPDDLVEFYDPTDVFGDLADAIAETWQGVAPELEGEAEGEGAADAETDEGDLEDDAAADDVDHQGDAEDGPDDEQPDARG
jgi:hypothetical protein